MNTKFIELTESDGVRIFLNVLHIVWIEPAKDGCTIRSSFVKYSSSKKVKETYDQVKALIGS